MAGAGIKENRPLTSRQITRALAIADQYRLGAVRANEDKLSAACGKIADPVVRQALAKLVRTDPGYGSGRLSDAHMEALGQRADDKVAAAREQRRSSAIRPGGLCPRQRDRIRRDCRQAAGKPAARHADRGKRPASGLRRGLDPENVKQVLASLGRASELLGKTAWHQEGLQALHGALSASRDQLETLRDGIAQAEIGAARQ